MNKDQMIDAIEEQLDITREIRKEERKYKSNRSSIVDSPLELKGKMQSILPKHLVPQNIGKISQILWPQFYEFTFNLADPATPTDFLITPNDIAKITREQITQDACFLLTSIHRDAYEADESGIYAPVGITIRDNTSTRVLNDKPIPYTSIGLRTQPTKLDVPFLVQPNASLGVELTPLWPSNVSIEDSRAILKIVVSGYRIRPDDVSSVMKSLYL